jgi:membrane glycosyltransferase
MELPVASEVETHTSSVHDSSYVRAHQGDDTRDDPRNKALSRVSEYLRALGLSDRLRVAALAEEIVSGHEESGEQAPVLSVASAQARVQQFREAVFGADEAQVDPLWFRSFIATHPDAFLADAAPARALAQLFGDPFQGRPPARQHFAEQSFARMAVPSWALGLLPPSLFTAAASVVLVRALAKDGLSVLELVWAGLFSGLCFLACVGLTAALIGFATRLFGKKPRGEQARAPEQGAKAEAPLPRSALLLPIYHESAEHVFAAVAAMRESLLHTEGGDAFEIFVLSDSREPARAAEEERAYRRVVALGDANVASLSGVSVPVYYRRRSRNERQKAGNLAEFFERFGHRYTYAVILDADSLMRGDTLVEMLRRMQSAPRVALLQAPLALHRGATLFARAQQFVASVCGPMFTRGLSVWAGAQGNYYGHNAVVRVRAFLECCALPVLSGEPPLGGHILSHDFVEAALLCRAGWEVRIAHDLVGSWEELPATLPDYVARDRRWCQGNLQHLRIAFAEGLRPMSRVHMLVGAAQYLAGPAWLAFVLVGAVLARQGNHVDQAIALVLSASTMGILLLPRLLGLIETMRDAELRRGHGGALRLSLGVLAEGLFSLLLAPLLMMHHTRIICSILLGRTVRWGAQARRAQGQLSTMVASEWTTTVLGALMLGTLLLAAPELTLWLAPLWLPSLLAIPLSLLASTDYCGQALRRLGILSVPSETEPDELLLRAEDLRALTMGDACARFRDMVLDPVLNHAHVARLVASERDGSARPEGEQIARERLIAKALRGGPTALASEEREALMRDAQAMARLHREAWQRWPVESFQLARLDPQLPFERLSQPHG